MSNSNKTWGKTALTVVLVLAVILSVIIGFYIVKDAKKPSISKSSQITISSNELVTLLKNDGINPTYWRIDSPNYALVSEKWIRNKVMYDFKNFIQSNGLEYYDEDTNDCVAYSTNFINVSYNRFVKDTKTKTTPAIGMYWYGIHSINVMVILNDNNEKQLLFYDPQYEFSPLTLKNEDKSQSRNIFFY